MSEGDDFVDVEVEVIGFSRRSVKVDVDGRPRWIPLEHCDFAGSDVADIGDAGVLRVKKVFAEKEALL